MSDAIAGAVPSAVPVLIVGVGSYAGPHLAASLCEAPRGFAVHTSDPNPWALGFARAQSEHGLPATCEADHDERLIGLCRELGVKGVFVASRDMVEYLSRRRSFFEAQTGARFFVSTHKTVRTVNDQLQLQLWLEKSGLQVFPTLALPTTKTSLTEFTARIGFPLVLRPRHGGDQHMAVTITDSNQLEELAGELPAPSILQAYLPGREVAVHVTCARDGEPVNSAGYYQVLRNGLPWRAQVRILRPERDIAEEVAKQLRCYGPCRVTLRFHDGRPTVMGVDVTWNVGTRILALAGVNEAVELAMRELRPGVQDHLRRNDVRAIDVGRYWSARILRPRADRPNP